jgi:hypothetical protein
MKTTKQKHTTVVEYTNVQKNGFPCRVRGRYLLLQPERPNAQEMGGDGVPNAPATRDERKPTAQHYVKCTSATILP